MFLWWALYVFVFQRLGPTWEAFAEAMEKQEFGVKVVKVDCVANRDLCSAVGSLSRVVERLSHVYVFLFVCVCICFKQIL